MSIQDGFSNCHKSQAIIQEEFVPACALSRALIPAPNGAGSDLIFCGSAADRHAIAHNKIMIIDQATIITGSFNFTKAAEEKNAENMLVIKSNPAQLYEP